MGYNWAFENLSFVAGYIILISALLVSRIPTFSIKRKQFFVQSRIVFLALFSVIALSIINFLWVTMNILAVIYLLTIPFSILAWQGNSK
jgi:CDP-diacylglycerol--serine O-phosphatidyltransferase